MKVNYDYGCNLHSIQGAAAALPLMFPDGMPKSILDVGCGKGTWLNAAKENGVNDFMGIDGVEISESQLLIPEEHFIKSDLNYPVDLGRQYSVVLCLEVAEHLDPSNADALLETLVRHSDTILFSAACPGQGGQNHVNCQWPSYWQEKFNRLGYSCDDAIRWRIWNYRFAEVWYRQNMFMAHRNLDAGTEPRISSVIHPEILQWFRNNWDEANSIKLRKKFEAGSQTVSWYMVAPFLAAVSKISRKLGGNK